MLIPLLENGELLIPGRGDYVKVAPGFQFFATRRYVLLTLLSPRWSLLLLSPHARVLSTQVQE